MGRWRHLLACSFLCAISFACSRDAERGGIAETREVDELAERAYTPESCIDSVIRTVPLERLHRLEPEDALAIESEHDAWTPGLIKDVEAVDGGYAVLDGQTAEMTILSMDLRVRHRWGGRGSGPTEFRSPKAVAGSPVSREIWVWNGLTLSSFTLEGEYRRAAPGEQSLGDLAVWGVDTLYLTRWVFPKRLAAPGRRTASHPTVVRITLGPDLQDIDTLRTVSMDSFPSEKLVMPHVNELNVRGGPGSLAVYYQSSGYVSVLRWDDSTDVTETSIRVCVPTALRDFYEEQRDLVLEHPARRNRQYFTKHITDVRFRSRDTLDVIGSVPDPTGTYHVDHYLIGGSQATYLGSTVFTGQGKLESNLKFGHGAGEIIGFHELGTISVYRYAREP